MILRIFGNQVLVLEPIRSFARDHESQFHVVSGAGTAHPPVDVPGCGGGDEIIFLTRFELQTSWTGTEWTKGDGSKLSWIGLVTDHHLLRPGVGHSAGDELMPGHAVDHVVLLAVLGTDEVELVILIGKITLIHCDHVGGVPVTEQGVGGVPVHIMMLGTNYRACLDQEYQEHLPCDCEDSLSTHNCHH